MPPFLPFKCSKSKRHTGRLGDWQSSQHGDENIALCVPRPARGEQEEEHRLLIQGSKAPAMSRTHCLTEVRQVLTDSIWCLLYRLWWGCSAPSPPPTFPQWLSYLSIQTLLEFLLSGSTHYRRDQQIYCRFKESPGS